MGRHARVIEKFPDHPLAQILPDVLNAKSLTLSQFDGKVTRLAGGSSPPFPFPTAWDYYAWASSHDVLADIRVPFLALNADDDPIVQVLPVGAGGNPFVTFAVTEKGGHLGWFERQQPSGELGRWVRGPILEWLRAIGDDLLMTERKIQPTHVVDGYLKEIGREDIGCKEVEGGGRIFGVEGEQGLIAGL